MAKSKAEKDRDQRYADVLMTSQPKTLDEALELINQMQGEQLQRSLGIPTPSRSSPTPFFKLVVGGREGQRPDPKGEYLKVGRDREGRTYVDVRVYVNEGSSVPSKVPKKNQDGSPQKDGKGSQMYWENQVLGMTQVRDSLVEVMHKGRRVHISAMASVQVALRGIDEARAMYEGGEEGGGEDALSKI